MSIAPDELRRQPYGEIGSLIERDADLLVDLWFQRALDDQTKMQALHRQELRDHLPDFLRALGRELASNSADGPTASKLRAIQHGEKRWRDGWQLAEVLRDYQILRLVIFEWLEQQLDRPLGLRESMAVGLALDDGIAAAVVMYVAYQNEALKKNQDSLQAAKELAETANRSKSDFLANLSHELRTPLNSILGLTQLILEEKLSPAVNDYVLTVKDSADVILSLLTGILDYARLESGRSELDPHPFSLQTVLDDTLRSLAVRADEKRLELAYEMPREVPDWLVGDALRLRQIITNLVSNAIKFTNEGAVVVEVGLQAAEGNDVMLEIVVSDTGIGIAPEVQQTIFEPFTQAAPSTARHYGGSGLGLAISKELTARMGGRLWVESELGQGSRFHFTVRFQLWPAPPVAAHLLAAMEQMRGLSILVVDDHARTRGIVVRALTNWGAQVQAVGDVPAAQAAIESAEAQGAPIQLLIVAALKPAAWGFNLVEWLNARGPAVPKVIMLLSNIDRSNDVARAEALGVAGYLIKPFSVADALETVADVFGHMPAPPEAQELPEHAPLADRKLRVLLAEDTPANQKLLKALLTRQGHEVVVVDHGREAFEQVKVERFDVVLMDLQMPVMDGTTATRLIRSIGKPRGDRVPIIALTAHALPQDERRCLEAGMDAYLAKPIDAVRLAQTLQYVTQDSEDLARMPPADPAPIAQDESAVMNRGQALQRLGQNEKLFADLVGFFLEDAPLLVSRVRNGLFAGDAETVERAAHSLRGLAANFDGKFVIKAAEEVEKLAAASRMTAAAAGAEALYVEIERLCRALAPYKPYAAE